MSTAIRTAIWTVPGVAEGEVRTLTAARAAVAEVRRRVGHIAAKITIIQRDGAWRKPIAA